jgi:hypothetical protein
VDDEERALEAVEERALNAGEERALEAEEVNEPVNGTPEVHLRESAVFRRTVQPLHQSTPQPSQRLRV